MWAIIWNNHTFWEKNEEAFHCYRINNFFKKLLIIGQSSEKNNVWNKNPGQELKNLVSEVPKALVRIYKEIITWSNHIS